MNLLASSLHHHDNYVIPPSHTSMEAYLLLESAWSDQVISRMCEDLTHEIVHHNTIILQLNQLVLENAWNNSQAVDEFVGHIHLSIRQSGLLVIHEQAIWEPHALHHKVKSTFGMY